MPSGTRRVPHIETNRSDVRELADRTRDAVDGIRQGSKDRWTITKVHESTASCQVWEYVRCNPSSGAFTVNLPVIRKTDIGAEVIVKNKSVSANTITIAAPGSDLIDGSTTATISAARGVVRLVVESLTEWSVS
tara:strand:- start:3036 stop:3437 length:402 start_codon:yes stop_codon:yes gene_type:complete